MNALVEFAMTALRQGTGVLVTVLAVRSTLKNNLKLDWLASSSGRTSQGKEVTHVRVIPGLARVKSIICVMLEGSFGQK